MLGFHEVDPTGDGELRKHQFCRPGCGPQI
jgi:hypothetical protein